ncbi:MAG: hypothetical protein LBM69_01055 [Lachnospiraceae bacterium]|nr:hypothetical protein [Lachnospiraceae bacterium]
MNRKTNDKIKWLTQTGALTALLVVVQAVTSSFGNTLITGSLVNLLLIEAVLLAGLSSGITIAFLSPFFAKLLGIGPLWSLIPFIALGNMVLVLLWHFLTKAFALRRQASTTSSSKGIGIFPSSSLLTTAIFAALGKFLVLYIGIVRIMVPYILVLPSPQADKISVMFSVPQLGTALIGGGIAGICYPMTKKVQNFD